MADPFAMEEVHADIMITGSQKALACPPGVSVIVFSEKAVERVKKQKVESLYFNLDLMLKNQERGQTPFTPAVGILLQIHTRLKEIERRGGVEEEVKRVSRQAKDFREKIKDLPFSFLSESPSNALTALHPLHANAYSIFLLLEKEYGIWVCPNGGEQKETVFRVGHLGALGPEENSILLHALQDLQLRGLL